MGIHIGKNTRSQIISKGISMGNSKNTYRGFININNKALGARNYSQCDSLLIGNSSNANTFPYIFVQNSTAKVEHEASASTIDEEQIFYLLQRCFSLEKAIAIIVTGFCSEVYEKLPSEFSVGRLFIKFKIRGKYRLMSSNIPILEIKKLQACVNDTEILKNLSLKINKGEIHAIMGPNGSGKSTFSKIIAGHPAYKISNGDILFNGKSILNLEPEERSYLGIFLAFQYPVEIPGVTNLNFLEQAYSSKLKAIKEKELDSFKILEYISKKAQSIDMSETFLYRNLNEGFSGGEKKRNEILQMVVLDPEIAILDETDSGLDIDALQTISKGINTFMNDQKAIVLITHYQRLLDYIKPTFVHVMRNGKSILN